MGHVTSNKHSASAVEWCQHTPRTAQTLLVYVNELLCNLQRAAVLHFHIKLHLQGLLQHHLQVIRPVLCMTWSWYTLYVLAGRSTHTAFACKPVQDVVDELVCFLLAIATTPFMLHCQAQCHPPGGAC